MINENMVVLEPENLGLAGSKARSFEPSPYDVPEAVVSYQDKESGPYCFDLKYVGGDEPLETIKVKDNLQIKTGKNSKRIYGFILDPIAGVLTRDAALNSLKEGLFELRNREKFTRQTNYDLITHAFANAGTRIVSGLFKTGT